MDIDIALMAFGPWLIGFGVFIFLEVCWAIVQLLK